MSVLEEDRQYHREERGLESMERRYIDSARMQRYLDKLSDYFDVRFKKPKFRPVFINKRLKRSLGLYCEDKIELAEMSKNLHGEILWHEMLHGIVADNYALYHNYGNWDCGMRKKVEKAVFQLEGNGEHHSHKYQLKCQCGWWIKTSKRLKSRHCNRCHKIIISQSEFNKLKRISKINSKVVQVNIDNYVLWKSNKKIGLEI